MTIPTRQGISLRADASMMACRLDPLPETSTAMTGSSASIGPSGEYLYSTLAINLYHTDISGYYYLFLAGSPLPDLADEPGGNASGPEMTQRPVGVGRPDHQDHPDPHVEG